MTVRDRFPKIGLGRKKYGLRLNTTNSASYYPIAAAGAELNALIGRKFCCLIVQQMRGQAERFKCKRHLERRPQFILARNKVPASNA